ncbi:hypothetical protein CLH62_08885 [Marinobacter guineae]|uniref:Uncharacterized protein n=1 Tax=Marinobacter guineae TaxID=432303 RepID=A0A2G1VG31_9GAMM|nr:hypothetical protein [Marinobacter guineae]PHQ25711.1 hypothetical protein CLH62_08885 [Marinobacter guineae]
MADHSRVKELVGYSFLIVFARDHILDTKELVMLETLALEDGKVDEKEKEVLRNLLDSLEEKDVSREVRSEIEQFREANNI